MSKINEERQKTLLDLKKKLLEHRKCLVVRGTGFGKTTMVSQLSKGYKKVLFLYPSKIVQVAAEKSSELDFTDIEVEGPSDTHYITNKAICTIDGDFDRSNSVYFKTYNKLVRDLLRENPTEDWSGYDLIVADECHRLGAKKTIVAINKLIAMNSKSHFIGLTATPNRPDKVDILSEVFDGIQVYEYSLFDMFEGGVLQRPYYYYGTYDVDESLKESALSLNVALMDGSISTIKSRVLSESVLLGGSDIIKYCCDKCLPSTDYMKFIVFYADVDNLKAKIKEVEDWFRIAYPSHKVKGVSVHSKSAETKDVSRLKDLVYENKTIHIIHSVNMLNQGYHVDDISGIIMLRGTKSTIIYKQQFGRVLNTNDTHGKLIIDLVDNLHKKALNTPNSNNSNEEISEIREELERVTKELKEESIKGNNFKCKMLRRKQSSLKEKLIKLQEEFSKTEKENRGGYTNIRNYSLEQFLVPINNVATEMEIIRKTLLEFNEFACISAIKAFCKHYCKLYRKSLPDYNLSSIALFLKQEGITKKLLEDTNMEYRKKEANNWKGDGLTFLPLESYCRDYNTSATTVIWFLESMGVFS